MEPGSPDDKLSPSTRSGRGSEPSRRGASRREVQEAYRKSRRHHWLRRGAIVLAAGLALLLVMGVLVYFKLSGSITSLDVSKMLGKRPVSSADRGTNLQPMNILVMGSDTRALGTDEFGTTAEAGGARSDTTLIVHLSGDRKSAVVVSVPRDSMTHAPSDCKNPNSPVATGPMRMWNANFSLGGPACLIRTVEGNTGIRIDHFMVLNFLGFQSMVEALGSVEVCVPTAINDSFSGLHLPAGRSRVNGTQALAFVRARHNVGTDGSDLGRIGRQQAFLSAMVQEATSSKLLLRPDKLFGFLVAAAKSLTTDPGLNNPMALGEVAKSAIGLTPSQIRFVTVPTELYPPDPNRVQWTSAADALWKAIRDDSPLPGTSPGPKPAPSGTPTAVLTIRPDKIAVQITNASAMAGRAQLAAQDLRIQGFTITATSTGLNLKKGVSVGYSSPNFQAARTVAAAFPGAVLVKDESAGSIIHVILGAGSPYVVLVPNRLGTAPLSTHAPATGSAVVIEARTADSNICAK